MNTTVESVPPSSPHAGGTRLLQAVCFSLVGVSVLGLLLDAWIDRNHLNSPHHWSSNNIFFYLFSKYDRWAFMAYGSLAAVLVLLLPRWRSAFPWPAAGSQLRLWHVAALGFLIMSGGTFLVCLNHPLAMDEFLATFQAQIFLSGHILGPIPDEWREYTKAMKPVLAASDEIRGTWAANYLPVYALLRTPFYWLGVDTVLNAAYSTGAVLLTAACARKIWPNESTAPWVAALLLGLGPQFLITGMTAYAMPAHLFFSMLWLWLWLRDDTPGYLLLPVVGVMAIGLHQPNIHAIFAAPFLLLLPFRAGWKATLYVGCIYAIGCLGWLEFMKYRQAVPANPGAASDAAQQLRIAADLFRAPNSISFIKLGMNFTQFFVWQPFVLGVFLILAFLNLRRCPREIWCLAGVFLGCLGFYFLSTVGQGHGWGNRFMHPFLGATALLATAGWLQIRQLPAASWLLGVSLACTLLVELPYRAWQARSVTEPFARTDQFLRSLPEPIVVVQVGEIWYGQDLVRNDATLALDPKFLFLEALTRQSFEKLKTRGRVRVVTTRELLSLGLSGKNNDGP